MHPDTLIAGLRKELERFPERAKEIEAEIARVDKLPRPAASPDEPETTVDARQGLLAGLRKELERAERELEQLAKDATDEVRRAAEARLEDIKREIARVKAELRSSQPVERAVATPVAEQATATPAPQPAPQPSSQKPQAS